MTGRPAAPVDELVRGRYVWSCEIPWLPDLLGGASEVTLTGSPLSEAFGRQIAFLRAVAAGAPAGTSLQLRFTATPDDGRIRCHFAGFASSAADGSLLNRIVTTALPAEFPLEPLDPAAGNALLQAVDPDRLQSDAVVEIRRSVDRLDPTVESVDRDDPVLFPWSWSPQALLASLGLLRFQPGCTVLVVQVEPATFPTTAAMFLQDEIRRLAVDLRQGEENPLALSVLRGYRRWLQLLPRNALSLRVVLATEGPLTPGIAQSLSTDLTRSFEVGADGLTGAADVVAPVTPGDLDACALLLAEGRSTTWALPEDQDIRSLLFLFDPLEANTAFRLPIAPRGGLAGIASRRLSSIGRGVDADTSDATVTLGQTASGVPFSLSERDLRQHVLVGGLPGFGKSSTVQLVLSQLWEQAGAPFLVIDPSKRDYEPLFADLAARGHAVRVHRLDRRQVAGNPLAVPAGVDRSVHAGRVLAAFDSALQLSATWRLAHVQLSRAIYRLYDDESSQPTMASLYRSVGDLLRRSPFAGEARANLEGSLLGRIEHLATGPLGIALSGGPADAFDWEDLLARPTLIELGAFAAPEERSLIFALLVAGLVSYREANPLPAGNLHVTVLEEAHRVLRPSAGDAGVEVFVDAIAELRASGEGFVVVDQAPSLLHPGLLKLTGTKLAHRLVDLGERTAVGSTMVLEGAQVDDLARLAPRRLLAYSASSSAASLVDVADWHQPDVVPLEPTAALATDPIHEPLACLDCPVMCTGRSGLSHLDALRVDDSASPRELLSASLALTGDKAAAYCLAAHSIASRHPPHAMRDHLLTLSTTYRSRVRPRPKASTP